MTFGDPHAWPLTFYAINDPLPGPGWQGLFSATWPGYRSWYLRDGSAARPDTATGEHGVVLAAA